MLANNYSDWDALMQLLPRFIVSEGQKLQRLQTVDVLVDIMSRSGCGMQECVVCCCVAGKLR